MKALSRCGLCLFIALLAGCTSPPIRYYRLSDAEPRRPIAVTRESVSLQIGPVALPSWLERPELVLAERDGRLTLLDQTRWSAPLGRLIAEALADRLAHDNPQVQITAWPQASPLAADYSVTLDVHALQARRGQGLSLDASWCVLHEGLSLVCDRLRWSQAQAMPGDADMVAAYRAAMLPLARGIRASLLPYVKLNAH